MIEIYNTLSQKKETFKPINSDSIGLFVCGPTVYDLSHLGHARTYIAFDVIVKYLRKRGFKIFYLQNITDIDDKIIARANELKMNPTELAMRFQEEYFQDMKGLKVTSVDKYAGATKYVKEIISQVKRLEARGLAYRISDGIYYDIGKFKNYGQLSGRTIGQAEDAVSRIDDSKEKRNKGDFCLWKFSKSDEPRWQSPWGYGRPGWHIEDTAITEKFFGMQYDMHGGARDLIFPHHEAEIAQMEGLSGKKPMVKYWMHTGFMTVRGQKMSKSLGNFITIKDFLGNWSPEVLRFIIIANHYRSPVDYSEKLAEQAKSAIERIIEFKSKISEENNILKPKAKKKNIKPLVDKSRKMFYHHMNDDFNTPKALSSIFSLIKSVNPMLAKNSLDKKAKAFVLEFLTEIDEIFGIIPKTAQDEVPAEIKELLALREKFRQKKQWDKADDVRKKIEIAGYVIEDTESGPKIKKI